MDRFSLALALVLPVFLSAATVDGLESYGDLTLVDSIVCASDSSHEFHEYPSGGSSVSTILGSDCRVLPHQTGSASYFSYRIGKGKSLTPGAMYLLVAEYPEDAPRTVTLINRAMDSRNGYHTGWSIGDTLNPHIITETHPESMDVPLAQDYRTLEQLMVLNEKVYPHDGTSQMLNSSTEGFDVIFQLFTKEDAPDSSGAAVRAIRLYRVENESALTAQIHYPGHGAPRRLVTWREEMSQESGYEMNADWRQNARIKTRLMKALGFNCFSRDMLEFGYNQWWDVSCGGKYNDRWYNGTVDRWSDELAIYGEAGLKLMPYYEYAGSRGPNGLGVSAAHKAVPLFDSVNSASHFNKFVQPSNGASGANVDLSDAAALDDFRRVLDCTVVRYRDQVDFAGVWIRNRGSMPMSFSDAALARFCSETGRPTGSVTRAAIIASAGQSSDGEAFRSICAKCQFPDLYKEYRAWWYGRRADFLSEMSRYLSTNGLASAKVYFSGTMDEAGPVGRQGTHYNEYFAPVAYQNADWLTATGYSGTKGTIGECAGYYQYYFLDRDTWTYYPYEYNHAAPMPDPWNYTNRTDVAVTYPYNTIYSVCRNGQGDAYRNASGDLFFSRHYCLYEGCNNNASGQGLNGYYTCDMDRAGRACMLPELYAVAYQDPTVIGYLQGNHLARNFTGPVREFHENFLSLPAVKGTVVTGGGWGMGNPTVRKYVVGDVQYYAIVNLSGEPLADSWKYVTDDGSVTKLYETVSGTEHAVGSGYMRYRMEPYQILCLSTEPPEGSSDEPPPPPEPVAPTLDTPSTVVSRDGSSVCVSVSVSSAETLPAGLELVLNGEVVKAWTLDAPGHFETELELSPYSTNHYVLVSFAGAATNRVQGSFVARVYRPWFTVGFAADGTISDDGGTWRLPTVGTCEIGETNGVVGCRLTGADDVTYTASSPSETGAPVEIEGTVLVDAAAALPKLPNEPLAAFAFVSGVPNGYGANGWTQLSGLTSPTVGRWVAYKIVINPERREIAYFVDGAALSPLLPLAESAQIVHGLGFAGTGAVGSFRGTCGFSCPPAETIEIVAPVIADGSGGASAPSVVGGIFSMSVANPVPGAYYTVFTSTTLEGTFVADDQSVLCETDGGLCLSVEANTPSKFARIVVSRTPFEKGTPMP